MKFKDNLLVVIAETEEERQALGLWSAKVDGHALALTRQGERTVLFNGLGPRADACREPINVSSRASDPAIRLISNFAHTPFELDGRHYASVEAFWQGLKFADEAQRQEIATLHGDDARRAGATAPSSVELEYGGQVIRTGTSDHWHLMRLACRAKFTQHAQARSALLGTNDRPLLHKMRRDSRTIPGVVMAQIRMRVRLELQPDQRDRSR